MAVGGEKRLRARRDYRPSLEGLEAVRLLSAAQAHLLPGMVAPTDASADPAREPTGHDADAPLAAVSSDTWDAALRHTRLADLLGGDDSPTTAVSVPAADEAAAAAASPADSRSIASGLSQLDRYLSRTWYRAGLPAHHHDDSTQAVYTTLLQNLGRTRFDALVAVIGLVGIREVLSRETWDGLAFFRAVDMVKKRAQREKAHRSIDSLDVPSESAESSSTASLRAALQDAISQRLNPREAELIRESLQGKTPAEIALEWGVTAKTISNEKSRVLQKLREALVDHESN